MSRFGNPKIPQCAGIYTPQSNHLSKQQSLNFQFYRQRLKDLRFSILNSPFSILHSQFSILSMNYLDIILIIPLAYGLVQGLRKGLVKEIAGLLAVVLGVYLARYFSLPASQALAEMTGWATNICTPSRIVLSCMITSLDFEISTRS